MARFDPAIALALKLILKNGELAVLRRRVDDDPPDAAKPWTPGEPTLTEYDIVAVFLDPRNARLPESVLKDGTQVVYVPASGMTVDPDPGTDVIVRAGGDVWTIVGVNTLCPNGQKILHQISVKE